MEHAVLELLGDSKSDALDVGLAAVLQVARDLLGRTDSSEVPCGA